MMENKERVEEIEVEETEAQVEREPIHFIEDLEVRKNASGPVTTLAVGEEEGGGGGGGSW